jgi:hypothetical protein
MSPVTRGFHGKPHRPAASRVPPGQHVVGDFPVLSAGPTQHRALANWSFSITGGRESKSWTRPEFQALPAETITVDIHCVTSWSKLDTTWRGVSLDVLLAAAEYDATYVSPSATAGTPPTCGGRPDWRTGLGGVRLRRQSAGSRARRADLAARTAPLLLEERQMGERTPAPRHRRARFLGNYGNHMYARPMAGTAVRGRLSWQTVAAGSVISETPTARTVVIDVPGGPGHRAGQHVDIRLTAKDGPLPELRQRTDGLCPAPGRYLCRLAGAGWPDRWVIRLPSAARMPCGVTGSADLPLDAGSTAKFLVILAAGRPKPSSWTVTPSMGGIGTHDAFERGCSVMKDVL